MPLSEFPPEISSSPSNTIRYGETNNPAIYQISNQTRGRAARGLRRFELPCDDFIGAANGGNPPVESAEKRPTTERNQIADRKLQRLAPSEFNSVFLSDFARYSLSAVSAGMNPPPPHPGKWGGGGGGLTTGNRKPQLRAQ